MKLAQSIRSDNLRPPAALKTQLKHLDDGGLIEHDRSEIPIEMMSARARFRQL
jgi:hypothetical protein